MIEQRRTSAAFPLFAAAILAACGQTQSPAVEPAGGQAGRAETTAPAALAGATDPGPASPAAAGSAAGDPTVPAASPATATTDGSTTVAAPDPAAAGAAAPSTAAPSTAAGDGGGGPEPARAAAPGPDAGDAGPAAPAGDQAPAAAPPAPAAAGDAAAPTRPEGWQPEDPATHPLSIQRLRGQAYPGSDLVVVQDLPAGSNYRRQVVSYTSEGLTIYGLFTVPDGERPATGWPVVIFNHGYIPPAQYRTTERYVAYQDAFARAGYITLKSDYRGHGSSGGEATSGRGSPAYTIDVLNAMASVLRHPDADPNRVGMWGHSMGGSITLRAMVLSDQIKAGVIWAGVVASYTDMYNRLGSPSAGTPNPNAAPGRRGWRSDLVERFGTPDENPAAWDAVSPNAHLAEISGPLQLHHGTNDHSVPLAYSERLHAQMQAAGQPSELFVYQGDDHNLSGNLGTALQRSVAFFDQHVKGIAPGG